MELIKAQPAANGEVLPGLAYRSYILVILSLVAATSTLDRHILTILVEPIRIELGLNDTQMGLLTGFAFAIVYTAGAIPLARLADRTSRRAVISGCVTFWSVMTIACGLAGNFWQLFLTRMGVGLGEAGNGAPTYALIADIFPQKQRTTALALYLLGPPIGMAGGLAMGGWALQEYGWRSAFLFAGLPGLILGPLVWFTVRNIRKGLADGATGAEEGVAFIPTLKILWSIKTLPYLIAASTITTLLGMGLASWFPAFLVRAHSVPSIEIGAKLGAAMGLGSILGHLAGGPLADWLGRWNIRAQIFIPIVTTTVATLLAFAILNVSSSYIFFLIGALIFTTGLFAAPLISIMTTITPVWARATSAAFLLFAINIIGLGVGPGIVGGFSDILKPIYGDQSLRMAMMMTLFLAVPALGLYYMASRHYRGDFEAAQARVGGNARVVSIES